MQMMLCLPVNKELVTPFILVLQRTGYCREILAEIVTHFDPLKPLGKPQTEGSLDVLLSWRRNTSSIKVKRSIQCISPDRGP